MTNKQLDREIRSFMKIRQDWIDIIVKNPENSSAASHILSINSKIELLRAHWNFNEEGEIPYGNILQGRR